jgi:hypothetical protein
MIVKLRVGLRADLWPIIGQLFRQLRIIKNLELVSRIYTTTNQLQPHANHYQSIHNRQNERSTIVHR